MQPTGVAVNQSQPQHPSPPPPTSCDGQAGPSPAGSSEGSQGRAEVAASTYPAVQHPSAVRRPSASIFAAPGDVPSLQLEAHPLDLDLDLDLASSSETGSVAGVAEAGRAKAQDAAAAANPNNALDEEQVRWIYRSGHRSGWIQVEPLAGWLAATSVYQLFHEFRRFRMNGRCAQSCCFIQIQIQIFHVHIPLPAAVD